MKVKTKLTAEELFAMGEIGPCELVRGELIKLSPAGGQHGVIAMRIGRLLADHVEAHGLGIVCAAETGFITSREEDTVRAPDAAFVSKERIPPEGVPEKYWSFAPDLAVEVICAGDSWSDVEAKVMEWLQAATRMVWVVNPRTQTVHVYRPAKEVRLLTAEDTLSGEDVLPGFSLPLAQLFA